jgi:hypothetical protein
VAEQQPGRWFRDGRVIGAALAGLIVGGVAMALLGRPWQRPLDWGDLPTWMAAVAAIYGGWQALSQLRQQQRAFLDEAGRQRSRDKLLDRQLRELEDREQTRIREQAEVIDMTWNDPGGLQQQSVVQVINGSRRPIRDVTCWAVLDESGEQIAPLRGGEMNQIDGAGWTLPLPQDTPVPIATLVALRGGGRAGFVLPASSKGHPGAYVIVQFTDDAGRPWHLGSDLSLQRAPDEPPAPIAGT